MLAQKTCMHTLITQFKVCKIMHSNSCLPAIKLHRDMSDIIMKVYYRLINEIIWKFWQKTQSEPELLKHQEAIYNTEEWKTFTLVLQLSSMYRMLAVYLLKFICYTLPFTKYLFWNASAVEQPCHTVLDHCDPSP